MPTKITVSNAGSNNGVIDYVYAADGIKLQKKKTQSGVTTTTDYAGDFVYENNTLKQFYQPEGYVEPDGSGWQYVYQYRDIWGNTRITYADDDNNGSVTSSEIRREQNYYPFGLEHKGYNINSYGAKNNLKTYQGQEFTEDLGLNTHEWKYRMSDPAIGRFWQIDPLAEDYTYNSTYAFQENKLGSGIELEGLENVEWGELSPAGGGGFATFVSELLGLGRIQDNINSKGQRSESELNGRSANRLISSGINASKTISDHTSITMEGNARASFGPQFAFGVEGVGDVEMGAVSEQLINIDGKIEFKLSEGVDFDFNVNNDNTLINRAGFSGIGGVRGELTATKDENGNYQRQFTAEGNLLLLNSKTTLNNQSEKTSVGLGTGIRAGVLLIREAEGGIFLNVENKRED